jgi:transposase InsO family protein
VSAFIDAHRDRFAAEPICREIEVSASAYRARRVRPPSARSLRDAWLLTQIRRVHAGCDGIYGQLKVWDELSDEGIEVARCTVERPDAVWLSDFTYIRTWEGWSYLAVVLDVHTRRIVGWQLASHMRQSVVTDAFEMALSVRQEHDGGLVAHSDNGSQYTSYEYTERLKRAGIAPSRGRTGTALDNAMAESVMSTLKREVIKRYTWRK